MVQAMQVSVSRPTGALQRVVPQQAYPQQVAPAQEFDISTLLASIMPLIMIIMVFMMLKPMLTGMAEAAK